MPAQRENVVRSAGVVSVAVLISRITGLVREIVMARLFGAGLVYDAFMLGFRIPNLTRDLFAEGALSSAFVPTFTSTLAQEGKAAAAELSNLVGTAIILVVGTFCVLGIVFAPGFVDLMAPGFHAIPGKFELAVRMTRIMFPFLLLVALAAQAMGVLNACNRFGSAGAFVDVVQPRLAQPRAGDRILGGSACRAFADRRDGDRRGARRRAAVNVADAHAARAGLPVPLPAELVASGTAAHHSADGAGDSGQCGGADQRDGEHQFRLAHPGQRSGELAEYAFRFMQLPLGLFGVAIASATLPSISRSAAIGNMDEFRRTLSHSLGMVLLLTLPSSVGLVVLGRSMIGAIYQGGKFHAFDTSQTALALACYAIGLTGYSALEGAESGVLRAARCADADVDQPVLDRD